MKLPAFTLAFVAFLVTATDSLAQTPTVSFRSWNPVVEPSNERPRTRKLNEVVQGWLCYSGRTGRLQSDCTVSFELSPGTDPVDIPGVAPDCVLNAALGIQASTCAHGGHTHGNPVRPVIFENEEVRYPGDIDGNPLTVTNATSQTSLLTAGFIWTAPINSGIFEFESSMFPPDGRKFVVFSNGTLFLFDELRAIGRLNVTFGRDRLRQLPDNPQIYDKLRGGNSLHPDEISYSSQFVTQLALTAIADFFLNSTGSKISYNDISLPKGGVFDFKAEDLNPPPRQPPNPKPWQPPHASHRTGLDVDINKPGGQRCDNNTSVLAAVSRFLERTTDNPAPPTSPFFQSALFCETRANNFRSDAGTYHIRVTRLRPVPFYLQFVP